MQLKTAFLSWVLPLITSLVIAIAAVELLFFVLLAHPHWARIQPVLFAYTRFVYESFDKQHIQYSEASRYHPDLFYTLRPGTYLFHGREFKSRYDVNSLGLRDDEASLKAPEIIALGDSFTLGWGVDQEEAFPALIEKQTGLKTLNAGMASYGTAREMLLLRQLDLSGLKYLILQHNLFDSMENQAFVKGGYRLQVSNAADFQGLQELHRKMRVYYPAKYTLASFGMWLEQDPLDWLSARFPSHAQRLAEARDPEPEKEASGEVVLLLLETLAHTMRDLPELRQVPVIFINLELDHQSCGNLIPELQARIKNPAYPPSIGSMRILDAETFLRQKDHYYVLDDHLNPKGHRAVADAVLRALDL